MCRRQSRQQRQRVQDEHGRIGFTVLHEFMGGNNDGWKPWSGLAISGDMIYGSTVYGGPHGKPAALSMK